MWLKSVHLRIEQKRADDTTGAIFDAGVLQL